MKISLKNTRLGIRQSTTRIPFRYGKACMTECPQAVLEAEVELDGGVTERGYSGDCLPPLWFDKSSGADFPGQVANMLRSIRLARETFHEVMAPGPEFFSAWYECQDRLHEEARESGMAGLLASFGTSMVERAIIDAIARARGVSFFELMKGNQLGIEAERLHAELAGHEPAQWLPDHPTSRIFVRHTVGLGDPLTHADLQSDAPPEDGLPRTLEETIRDTGIRFLKIKVSNRLEQDLDRLLTIAALIERYRGSEYGVTLDGNEQYREASRFDEFIDKVSSTDELGTLWTNTLVIEQPLDRAIAIDPAHTAGIRSISLRKPVIIDESDDCLDSYPRAIELGYRGVSSKNCKGPIKSIGNAGLTWVRNEFGKRDDYVMTGEDLCTVGIIPVQSDLCLVATLGLKHVERNGHHFHRGLSYLPRAQQELALEAHPDFYSRVGDVITPHVVDGQFNIESLQCPGYGFAVRPDFQSMVIDS